MCPCTRMDSGSHILLAIWFCVCLNAIINSLSYHSPWLTMIACGSICFCCAPDITVPTGKCWQVLQRVPFWSWVEIMPTQAKCDKCLPGFWVDPNCDRWKSTCFVLTHLRQLPILWKRPNFFWIIWGSIWISPQPTFGSQPIFWKCLTKLLVHFLCNEHTS